MKGLPERYKEKLALIKLMTDGKPVSEHPAVTSGVLLKFIVDLEERIDKLEVT